MNLQFLDLYPSDTPSDVLVDLSLRRLFCDFLSASLLVMMARSEDNLEIQVADLAAGTKELLTAVAATLHWGEKSCWGFPKKIA